MTQAVQQALIVDDSVTARVTLQKMLAKHSITAQMVESGEEALEFLHDHHPDVIFMDHMMPGMDGFAAVKAIKSNPSTSTIPIVMHTTKQGDIYLGQAKALGAVDILSKPASDQAVIAVLERVRQAARPASSAEPVRQRGGRQKRPALSSDTMELDAYAVAMAAKLVANPEMATESADFAGSHAPVTRGDNGSSNTTALDDAATQAGTTAFFGTGRQWLLALVWLLPILWLLSLYLPADKHNGILLQQQRQYIESLEWAINQRDSYDFGEAPLSDQLLDVLQQLLPRLSRAGFTGVVRLEGHIGEFCLSTVRLEDGTELAMLPEANLPLTSCSMIGYSPAQAATESVLQSQAFRDYLHNSGLLSADAPIRVEITARGSSRPLYSYPETLEGLTTGDWNAVALRNNRVDIKLLSD